MTLGSNSTPQLISSFQLKEIHKAKEDKVIQKILSDFIKECNEQLVSYTKEIVHEVPNTMDGMDTTHMKSRILNEMVSTLDKGGYKYTNHTVTESDSYMTFYLNIIYE